MNEKKVWVEMLDDGYPIGVKFPTAFLYEGFEDHPVYCI